MQSGHLMLVIDEAHYLFPQTDVRRALPNRVNWMLTELVNFGVAVALISTPQFTASQRVIEKTTHWASEQFIGRIARYTRLPDRLDQEDLEAVARFHLPEGDKKSITALVAYAQASRKYLAGIEHATKAARYEAQLQGRKKVTFDDIKRAIATSFMPSDAALQEALSPKLTRPSALSAGKV
jgi:histone H3/H4